MATEHQHHDAASDDTVVTHDHNDKYVVEESAPAMDHEHTYDEDLRPEQEKELDATALPEEDGVEKKSTEAPLDRTPSQAAKMGKKKIILVMAALCVRSSLIRQPCMRESTCISKKLIKPGLTRWLYFWRLWIWYALTFLFAISLFRICANCLTLQTIISTALPTIATDFHATESGFSWIASSYLLANAACIPLWGKISDIWGRKPIILLANVTFLVGSLVCALAKNLPMILAGRAIQGIGGGGIIILANISVSDLFSMRYALAMLVDSVPIQRD